MSEPLAPRPADVPPAPSDTAPEPRGKMPVWLVRTIVGAVLAVVLVVSFLIASITVPLVWANSIKDQVGNDLGNSIPLGVFYGFVFSFVPVLVAWQAHHKRLAGWARVAILAVAALLTLPNLLTLSVLYGTSDSARDARASWREDGANWFDTWSQSFMVVGVVCAVAVIVLLRIWRRRGKKLREVKAAEKLLRDSDVAQARAEKAAAQEAERAARDAARRKPTSGTPDA